MSMAKSIGVIAEDDSDIDVVRAILEKYAPRNQFCLRRFVGNGCGKLRNKCTAWANTLFAAGCQHVLVFHDLDGSNEEELRNLLEHKLPRSRYPASVIVIPIEEMEAWLLSDEFAIQSVFSLKAAPKQIRNCEQVNSPKEHLGELVWRLARKRYLNTVHNKRIAERATLDRLRRCKSFLPLDAYVQEKIFQR